MKAFLKNGLGLLVLVAAVACEKASETVVGIPNVRVGCTKDDDNLCSTDNLNPKVTAYVRMTRSGCSNINFDPVATGSIDLMCDGLGCEGVISSWIDPETSDPVTEILTGTMDICSQVDLNDNINSDTGDLINEDSRGILSSSTITVDTWTQQ